MATLMSDMHEGLPPKAWRDMDQGERKEAARLLRIAASRSFTDMVDEINAELKARGCPLRAGGRLVITWGEPL